MESRLDFLKRALSALLNVNPRPKWFRPWDISLSGRALPESRPGEVLCVLQDLFDPHIPQWVLEDVLTVVAENPRHYFFHVTPFFDRARSYLSYATKTGEGFGGTWIGEATYPANLWFMALVSNEETARHAGAVMPTLLAPSSGLYFEHWPTWSGGSYERDLMERLITRGCATGPYSWIVLDRNLHPGAFEYAQRNANLCGIPYISVPDFQGLWPQGFDIPNFEVVAEEDDGLDKL